MPPRTHDEAFMEDICANPDDDTPRLIYADWLDDHGQNDRAEFIRLQIERANLNEFDERKEELRRRERQLFDERPFKSLSANGDVLQGNADLLDCYQRGFLDRIVITASKFITAAESLYRLGPLTDICFLRDDPKYFAAIANGVWAPRLRGISLYSDSSWDQMKGLLLSQHLTAVQALSLFNVQLPSSSIARLLDAPVTRKLKYLTLWHTSLNAAAAEQMAKCASWQWLLELDLSGNNLGNHGVQFLTGSRHLHNLRGFVLSENQIGASGARALASTTRLSGLLSLDLSTNPLGNEGVAALSESSTLKAVTSLRLSDVRLGIAGMEALARSSLLRQLRLLSLDFNQCGNLALQALCQAISPLQLQSLGLQGNELDDDGAKILSRWRDLVTIRNLQLGQNKLTAFGLKDILSSPNLGPLHALEIADNRLGDLGLQVLARWPGLANLQHLQVGDSFVKNVDSYLALLRSDHYGKPKTLLVNCLNDEMEVALREELARMRNQGRIFN